MEKLPGWRIDDDALHRTEAAAVRTGPGRSVLLYPAGAHIRHRSVHQASGNHSSVGQVCGSERLTVTHHGTCSSRSSKQRASGAQRDDGGQHRAQGDDPRARTRRGRVLTTIPRVLHLDVQLEGTAKKTAMFGAEGLETGTDLPS